MIKVEIMPIQPEELSQAVDVLGRAFATQPSSIAIHKGRSDIEKRMQIVFGAMLKHMPGQVFVAKQDGRIAGAMRMVEWPGCQMKPLHGLRMLHNLLKAGGWGTMRRGMKMRGTWAITPRR